MGFSFLSLRAAVISFWISLTLAAIDINGSPVAWLAEGDNVPIDAPDTYYRDAHDCPGACVDYTNVHSWIAYPSIERLERLPQTYALGSSYFQAS
jgi:hypothetical protein